MRLLELRLLTQGLDSQKHFYTHILGLPLLSEANDRFTVKAGMTNLVFLETDASARPFYHFAFNIPENKFALAKIWTRERFALLRRDNEDEVYFQYKNAHSFFFYDAMGNILEFIARHDLPNASQGGFEITDILCVSEIGLPVDDVDATVDLLCSFLGVEVYKTRSETFTMVGDEYGNFVVVKRGRNWLPTNKGAEVHPIVVIIQGDTLQEHVVPNYPYEVFVKSAKRT